MPEVLTPEIKPELENQKDTVAARLRSAVANLRNTDFGPKVDGFLQSKLPQAVRVIEKEELTSRIFGEKMLPDRLVIDSVPEASLSDYDRVLQEVRNLLVEHKSSSEEIAAFLKELPDEPEELGEYVKNAVKKTTRTRETLGKPISPEARKRREIIDLVCQMGISAGALSGKPKPMEDIIDLKKHFNFETKQFE